MEEEIKKSSIDKEKNLRYYSYSKSVPKEALKPFKLNGMELYDINPMWRIKILTEMYGPCGVGWYTRVINKHTEEVDDETIMAIVDIELYIKVDGEWSMPIYGTGGNTLKKKTKMGTSVSDEGYKMAYTDAISVACKQLGIGADVYWGSDKTKYSQYYDHEAPKPTKPEKKQNPPVITGDAGENDAPPFDMPDNPAEVSQEMLTAIGKAYLKDATTEEKRAITSDVKAINDGKASYKDVADADIRKKLYDLFNGAIKARKG